MIPIRFYSKEIHSLLASMLQRDPEMRPSIDNILENQFFKATKIPINLTTEINDGSTHFDWKITDLHDKFNSLMKRYSPFYVTVFILQFVALAKKRRLL